MHASEQANRFAGRLNVITKQILKKKPKDKLSIRWRRVLNRNALIGSHFLVSKLSSSRNNIMFFPSAIFRLFIFSFLFWLGSAYDHKLYILTITSFYWQR